MLASGASQEGGKIAGPVRSWNTKPSPFEEHEEDDERGGVVERLWIRQVLCNSNTGLTAAFQDDRA